MSNKLKYFITFILAVMASPFLFTSCSDFFDPDQELNITEDELYNDWYEYRSVAMGLYGLQQQLVEQIVVLGELRGDLLTVTPSANADLVEIYNFNISKENKYASPTNFFKLISASNNLIRVLQREHPEVLDNSNEITNYDKLYGEAICMRAWAYFNAVKIYGKVPYIHESLVTLDEINQYVNSPGSYIDSVYIVFGLNGYNNDTIYNTEPVTLEKNYYDLNMVIDHFSSELESIDAVGVKHDINAEDPSWEITIWNIYAKHALLGEMYLTSGDLSKAALNFEKIINNSTETHRYQLTNAFAENNWGAIFALLDNREHIFSIWFDKTYFQQHGLQNLFMPIPPYDYMLKPTQIAIDNWETSWFMQTISHNTTNPALSTMINRGVPGDLYRGYGTSYLYLTNDFYNLSGSEFQRMLEYKSLGDMRSVANMMMGMDTIVFKYYSGQYNDDSYYSLYRASSIHLYLSEIYNYWVHVPSTGGSPKTELNRAMGLVNYGEYFNTASTRLQMGVRGRVGYTGNDDALNYSDIQYIHNPYTNEIEGYLNLGSNLLQKQQNFEEDLLDERARELAFEGGRFYDLIRIAIRRNDPAFLASRVAAKYPSGRRAEIYNYLLDENNWYIQMFD